MEFKKAVKSKQKLRLAIDGISGSGKTYTALAVASGMGGPAALIDSEHGSASLYADRFPFDTLCLGRFEIEDCIEALEAAAKYPVVIIDSTSHAWDALVERVDRIAAAMPGGNASFRAWAQGTPLQKRLIEAMLGFPGHLIVTCRSKTEYSVDRDEKGKTTISKVGTAAVQRQGFEYEFTMAVTMDGSHSGRVTKDRTGKFQDKIIRHPGEEFGAELVRWLNEGAEAPPPAVADQTPKSGRQEAINRIAAAVTAKRPDGEGFFTDKERDEARAEIKKAEGDLGSLGRLAAEHERELENRRNGCKAAKPEGGEAAGREFENGIPWEENQGNSGKAGRKESAFF